MTKLRAVAGARVKVFQDDSEHSDQWVIIGTKGEGIWVDAHTPRQYYNANGAVGGYHLQNQATGALGTLSRNEFEVVGNLISEQMEQSIALFEMEEV